MPSIPPVANISHHTLLSTHTVSPDVSGVALTTPPHTITTTTPTTSTILPTPSSITKDDDDDDDDDDDEDKHFHPPMPCVEHELDDIEAEESQTDRQRLYALMIRQLVDDEHVQIANQLSDVAQVDVDHSLPLNMLRNLLAPDANTVVIDVDSDDDDHDEENAIAQAPTVDDSSMKIESDTQELHDVKPELNAVCDTDAQSKKKDGVAAFIGMDDDDDDDDDDVKGDLYVPEGGVKLNHPRRLPPYHTRFMTTHKGPVRCAAFSFDGSLVATGSVDSSIKILSVDKMHCHAQMKSGLDFDATRPVIRSLYDHQMGVNELKFHPLREFVVSCSDDRLINFFDLSRSNNKRAFRQLREESPVHSIEFHASGDFLVVGTDSTEIRMYDVNTFARFCSEDESSFHTAPIVCIAYARDASYYASCSLDGAIKIWDGVTSQCVRTIDQAHSGEPVHYVSFSHNGDYILSNGGDDVRPKLWDVASGRVVLEYAKATSMSINGVRSEANNARVRTQSAFSHDESFVFACEQASLVAWHSRTGERVRHLQGHSKLVRAVAVSPIEPAIITCSDDFRARFWATDH